MKNPSYTCEHTHAQEAVDKECYTVSECSEGKQLTRNVAL